MSELNILVVEDEAIIAEDIATICANHGHHIVDTVHTAGQAICAIEENQLDLVLLDVNLEDDIDGVDIANFIIERKKLTIYIYHFICRQ